MIKQNTNIKQCCYESYNSEVLQDNIMSIVHNKMKTLPRTKQVKHRLQKEYIMIYFPFMYKLYRIFTQDKLRKDSPVFGLTFKKQTELITV